MPFAPSSFLFLVTRCRPVLSQKCVRLSTAPSQELSYTVLKMFGSRFVPSSQNLQYAFQDCEPQSPCKALVTTSVALVTNSFLLLLVRHLLLLAWHLFLGNTTPKAHFPNVRHQRQTWWLSRALSDRSPVGTRG